MNKKYTNNTFLLVVKGTSMFPTLKDQDQILVEKVASSQISPLDIVVFKKIAQQICHRVIKIKRENNEKIFYIKGDSSIKNINKVGEKDILGKVLAVYRKDKLKFLNFKLTILYYILINNLAFFKKVLSLYAEKFYSFFWARKLLKILSPLNTQYVIVNNQEDRDLFDSFHNVFPFDETEYYIFHRILAILDKKPIAKLWILKEMDTGKIFFYGPYVRLLYRARRIGTGLVKKALEIIDNKEKNKYFFLYYQNKQLLKFYSGFGFINVFIAS